MTLCNEVLKKPEEDDSIHGRLRSCHFAGTTYVASTFTMSYYFSIIGTRDNPLFELDFGTSKVGGDGVARFKEEAKYMNQFIVHAALDAVEEIQWANKEL